MTMYHLEGPWGGDLFPFLRWIYYEGGYKSEQNGPTSRSTTGNWAANGRSTQQMEFTMIYTITDRTNTNGDQRGHTSNPTANTTVSILRFQFQANYSVALFISRWHRSDPG